LDEIEYRYAVPIGPALGFPGSDVFDGRVADLAVVQGDSYDEALVIAATAPLRLRRSGDLIARYGGLIGFGLHKLGLGTLGLGTLGLRDRGRRVPGPAFDEGEVVTRDCGVSAGLSHFFFLLLRGCRCRRRIRVAWGSGPEPAAGVCTAVTDR
jgi:hypothetical protein